MPMSPTLLVPRENEVWTPANWSSSQLWHWYHGGVPSVGLASTIQGGVGNTTTGWNDASGNARHVNTTITGTPDVVKPNQIEGINFVATGEHMLATGVNAPNDTAGTRWVIFRLNAADNENATRNLCGWGASGSGTRNEWVSLATDTGECKVRCLINNAGISDISIPMTAGQIVPGQVHSIVWEAVEGVSYRLWLDGVEYIAGSTAVVSGTAGTWWNTINTGSQLNRFGIGAGPTNTGMSSPFNGHIYEIGTRRAALGADEANLLAHVARQRAAA